MVRFIVTFQRCFEEGQSGIFELYSEPISNFEILKFLKLKKNLSTETNLFYMILNQKRILF